MIRLPPRRNKNSGKGSRFVCLPHQKWVRGHACSVPSCASGMKIEFAHVRKGAHTPKDRTGHDWFGISLCSLHHAEQHKIGEPAFERKYGINLMNLARSFALYSPHRKALKEAGCTFQ